MQRLFILDTGVSLPDRLGSIQSCLTDGNDLRTVIKGLEHNPDGITIDHQAGRIYWTNMGSSLVENNGSIESAKLDGSDRKIVVPKGTIGVHTPKQITYAAKSRTLYWCDREGMKVMRCGFDGSDVEVLVSTGSTEEDRNDLLKHCVGIAVDESQGYFYWSQKGPSKGNQGQIFRSRIGKTMTTSNPEERCREMVLDNLPEPIDLEVDEKGQSLFWTDRGDPPKGNTLNRFALGDVATIITRRAAPDILARHLHEAIGLSIDHTGKKAYVTDLAGGVYAINLETKEKNVLFQELGDLTGVALCKDSDNMSAKI